jgi:cation diffusion facilitator family transporter
MSSVKQRVAVISIFASGSMAVAKFVVGTLIGSIALISDALHSLVDLTATIITWLVVRVADRPADAEHHYGHGKLESLSALGVTALLYVLAGGIVVEAFSRLRDGTPPPTLSVIPFAVLTVEIAVNLWRARALHQTAMDTKSQALEADALHFSSDVYSSLAVMAGLGMTAAGFAWGDAAAAIAVAVIIAFLGLNLARSTIEALLDRAPEGASEQVEEAVRAIPGVVDVERVRVRNVGPRHFVDVIAHVPRTFPIDRIDTIKRQAETAVNAVLSDTDLTFTTIPVARDNESVRDRIMVIARNRALAIHHVTVHNLGEKLVVGIDLEVDGDMPLALAHDIAMGLESAIRDDIGPDIEVDVHIEPLQPDQSHGHDAAPARMQAMRDVLQRLVAEHGDLHDVHYVRVRESERGEIVNFHCHARPDIPVIEAHEKVDALERGLRQAFPTIARVISHAEPGTTPAKTQP